jgi:GT2 family glycosyltransferase
MIQDGWVWIIDDDTLHDRDVFNRLGHVVQENPNAAVVVFSQEHVLGHTLHAAP